MENNNQLVTTESQNTVIENQPTFNPEADIEKASRAAKALMAVVKATKPLTMNGKKYLYFEHWQTIGQFFNHTVGIEWTKEIKEGDIFTGYEAKAVLYNKDGIIVGGAEASCTIDEKNWNGKPKFQLKSMAQTRAMSKALRSRFGFVPVLEGFQATPAEEMIDAGDTQQEPFKTETKMATQKQINFLAKILKELGAPEDKEEVKTWLSEFLGVEITQSANELTSRQISEIIDKLIKLKEDN